MNFDLTDQFVHDYETLRKRLEQPPEPHPPPPNLLKEIEKLKQQNAGLQEKTRLAEETARAAGQKCKDLHAEIEKLQEDLAKKGKALEKYRVKSSEYAKILDELKKKNAKTLEELQENQARELGLKQRSLDQYSKEMALNRNEVKQLQLKLKKSLSNPGNTAFFQLQEDLKKIASLPLRMRLLALCFDVSLLVIGVKLARKYDPAWDIPGNFGRLLVLGLAAFSLRTFASPGRLLLGISPRRIGRDFRPRGPAGFAARLFCGLIHYGPLIAALYFVTEHPEPATESAVSKLSKWVVDPARSKHAILDIVPDFFDLKANSPPQVAVTLTLAWWGVLLASLLLSRWIYPSTPFFRNTTWIETICRVGFQRFDWPDSANAELSD